MESCRPQATSMAASLILLFSLSFSLKAFGFSESIIEEVKFLYASAAMTSFGKPLSITIEENESISAAADHTITELKVIVHSGLLKSPRLTADGLRMIICHELGHLFGGSPRSHPPFEWDGPVASDGMSLMSSEGQADYYAGLVCFKKLVRFSEQENIEKIEDPRIGPELKRKCYQVAGLEEDELALCYRAALGGLDFLTVTHDFPISCETEDTSIAPDLIRDTYPPRQCRLDTIIRGASCPDDFPLALDFYQDETNSCRMNYAERPLCWYP
jgi:hypothetical protein